MAVKMLDLVGSIQGFLRQCSARLLLGSALVFLITASALAGTKPSQPTASGPADVAAAMNGKCPNVGVVAVKDQPVAASQSIPAADSAAAALTTAVAEVAEDAEPPKTEMLQEKLWSTSLSRSSKGGVPKAPQCGLTTAVPPPAN